MDRRAMWLVVLASLTVLSAACAGSSDPQAGASGGSSAGTPTSPTVEVPEVLDFEAPLLGGGTFHGATLAGRDVAFWFWAPW